MHISLKFENLDPRIRISWSDLRRIEEVAGQIYPKLSVKVELEFSYATVFQVDPRHKVSIPKGPVKVSLAPMENVVRSEINPQYNSIVAKLVLLINRFLAVSDRSNDSSIQPSYFPPSVIEISAVLDTADSSMVS